MGNRATLRKAPENPGTRRGPQKKFLSVSRTFWRSRRLYGRPPENLWVGRGHRSRLLCGAVFAILPVGIFVGKKAEGMPVVPVGLVALPVSL